jgi:F-box-like
MLPDDVLLQIFDFFVREAYRIEGWQTLVHVCRRWRCIVFGSPRRLNLQLVCSAKMPAKDTLDVWPAFPLSIECSEKVENVNNIIAVLEHSDRVCYIYLHFNGLDLDKLLAAMQVPFPELTELWLSSNGKTRSALPDSFVGGSAPRLEDLFLDRIPFPGLPKLLLSATHLATLYLENIPHSGYFSPEAIVTTLSTLTRLVDLWLEFESPQSRPDPEHQHPPPPTHSVLPNFESFHFKGDSEYLEGIRENLNCQFPDNLQ